MEEFVKLKDITKVYHMGEVEIRAADNINFSIKKGEFVVIVGPSGAGKTTVLNILGGMDTATGGTLTVDGKDITAYDSRQLTGYRRDDIGFVFQFYNLIPNLTALENVELALQICKDPLDAKEAGLIMTGAGATFPYGKDPKDSNIRIAPSFPTVEELAQAAEIFVLSVKLVSVEKLLGAK